LTPPHLIYWTTNVEHFLSPFFFCSHKIDISLSTYRSHLQTRFIFTIHS